MHSLRNISASSFRRRIRGGCGSISKHRTFAYASIRKRVWHRFERRYSGLAEAGNFQPVAHGLLPEKTGEKEFLTVGAANRNTKDVFRERIARYVGDDPELAERIRLSSAIRSKTIQLLRDYDPTKY